MYIHMRLGLGKPALSPHLILREIQWSPSKMVTIGKAANICPI